MSQYIIKISCRTIAWWMLDLWFGLDASGFDKAFEFDFIFGPILMITYACLSNTLLLTVLVSILSNTFAKINDDAAAEAMFRRAVSTIEGVKADSLFSYQPPVNLLALCILLPSSYVLSPRWFHKVNVFMIRATNFPILLIIAWYERQSKKNGSFGFYDTITSAAEKVFDTLPRSLKRMSFFEGLVGSGGDIDIIFEVEQEMDNSALDTGDYGELPPLDAIAQRRPSRKSDHETSLRPARSLKESQSERQRPPRPRLELPSTNVQPSSLSQPELPTWQASQPSGISALRRRVNSQFSRDDMAQGISPLAQVFQPLVVDDDVPKDGLPQSIPLHFVSYGPASRRRLASIQSGRRPTDTPDPTPTTQRRSPWPVTNTRREAFDDPGSLSTSLQNDQPETAQESEETSSEDSSMVRWFKRIESMEERQKRIEDMLLELTGRAQRG